MPWSTPSTPVSGTVITVAWAQASVVDPINWLRGLTGSADPPGADRVVRSISTTGTNWSQITNGCYAAGSITSDKFAPLNDTSFASGGRAVFFSENGLKVLLIPSGAYALGVDTNIAYVQTQRYVTFHNSAAAAGDYSMVYDTQTHVMTINGQTVYHTGNAGAFVPSGLIAAVATAAAIPSGWTRYTNADGRILIGAGTTFSQTFTENTAAGNSNWTPLTGISVNNDATNVFNAGVGATAVNVQAHQHLIPTTTWIPPVRVVVHCQKT